MREHSESDIAANCHMSHGKFPQSPGKSYYIPANHQLAASATLLISAVLGAYTIVVSGSQPSARTCLFIY
jgi:hypothetical protein